jgi:predicted metal-binding membrane protein
MTLIAEIAYWMLMVAAMMLPLVTDTVRFTAFASLWARRHRAVAGFVFGYFAPWLAVGIVAATLRQANWTHTYAMPAIGFAVAAQWQRTATYKRALGTCRRTWPIAPLGWRADRDCIRFGSFIGFACIRTCWPLMFACEFAGHSLIAMIGGMVVGFVERQGYRRRRSSATFVGTLAMASYYTVLAVLELGGTGAA